MRNSNVDPDHLTSTSNSGESFDILHHQPGPMNNDAQIGIPSYDGSGVTNGNDTNNTGLMSDINQLYQQQLLHQQNINTSLGGNTTTNNNTNYDIANEIKRWQQYHTNNNVLSNTPTALLSNTSSNTSGVPSPQLLDANSTSASAFLQQMIESQQQHRFDIPLAGSFALPGTFGQQQVIGSVSGSGSSSNNNSSSNATNVNAASSDLINNSIVNHELFNNTNLTDPNNIMNNTIQQQIYMMAQQAANLQAVMNYHQSNNNNNIATTTNGTTTGTNTTTNPLFLSTNPILFPQHDPLLQQSSSSSFAVFPDLVDANNNSSNINSDLPLPSPHSLFHRDGSRRMRGGVIEPFPEKLHRLLLEVEGAGRSDIISFVSSGRAFQVHKPDKFFKDIVPLYFRQSRLSSFKRQLNLYGFELINTGPSRGGYFHELFIKDQPELCRRMRRVAIKLTAASKVNTFDDDDDTNENHCMTPQELYEMQRSNLGISSFH